RDLVRRQERVVVEAGHVLVAAEEERELPAVGRWTRLRELLNRAPAARAAGAGDLVAVFGAGGVGVARLVEEELLEVRARPEQAVLRTLERRAVGRLRQRVRVERGVAVHGGVVNRDPPGV